MIITVLFLVLCGICVRLACKKPGWFWVAYVAAPLLLEIVGTFTPHFDAAGIPLGPLLIRETDAGNLGALVGVLWALKTRGVHIFRKKPGGRIVAAMLAFFAIKIAWTVFFGNDVILHNRTASHVAFGLVAAVGDLRDNLVALILPVYAYATADHIRLKDFGRPVFFVTLLIFIRSAVAISVTHQIFGTSDTTRFVSAHEAVSLLIFSLILWQQGAPRIPRPVTRFVAAVGWTACLVANHRSVWFAALSVVVVILVLSMAARPLFGDLKSARLALVGGLLLLMLGYVGLQSIESYASNYPLLDTVRVRLYALTDPRRDANSKWRETVWQDRVAQVGSDWPWGRLLGDRSETLYNGHWLTVPDHSAYVSTYELGGVTLCVLLGLFWLRMLQIAVQRIFRSRNIEQMRAPALALMIAVGSIAFGTAYDFPWLGPSLVVVLTLDGSARRPQRVRNEAYRTASALDEAAPGPRARLA